MPLLLIPLLFVAAVVVAVGILFARYALGDAAPSWLRGTAIALGGAFVFFALSGLAVLLLIIEAFSLNPVLLWASAVSLLLAIALPLAAWFIARPGLRRQRAAEAERWVAMSAQYEAERARRAAYYDELRAERLRELREGGEARAAARASGASTGSAPVYYEILGIAVDASGEDIDSAYRREMRLHHPDRGGEPRRAQLINEAYEALRDPEKRRAYDRENGVR